VTGQPNYANAVLQDQPVTSLQAEMHMPSIWDLHLPLPPLPCAPTERAERQPPLTGNPHARCSPRACSPMPKPTSIDMTVGQRTGEEFRESIVKAPLRGVLKVPVEYTAGRSIPDINSGLRIFDRAMAMRFFARLCDTFSFTTSLTLAFVINGLYVAHVPIAYYKRKGESKVRLLQDSLNTIQYVAEAAIYYNPLRIFLPSP